MGKGGKQNTVIFSMPGTTEFWQVHRRDFGISDKIPATGGYFIIHPFAEGPALYIDKEVETPSDLSAIAIEPGRWNAGVKCSGQAEYEHLVVAATEYCRKVNGKVVLSRVRELHHNGVEWEKWLAGLRAAFPGAFVYLLHTERYGTWMGATPETLVQYKDDHFQTDALAGTRWGEDPFTEKEFEEQEVVCKSILQSLQAVNPVVSERKEVSYGNLRHLHRRISWTSEETIIAFARLLHPTPAVCGLPFREAFNYIREHESHNRQLYTGYLGNVNSGENAHLFVNLRCMQLFRDRIRIFAGGGINAMSDPHAEWEETERKMNALIRAMNIHDGNI